MYLVYLEEKDSHAKLSFDTYNKAFVAFAQLLKAYGDEDTIKVSDAKIILVKDNKIICNFNFKK